MASIGINIVPLIPKNMSAFQAKKYAKRIEKAVTEETVIFENLYKRVSSGMSDQTVFQRSVGMKRVGFLGLGGNALVGETKTSSVPFVHLDQGFKQTHLGIPTDGWRPRTTVRTLGIKGRTGELSRIVRNQGVKVAAREYSKEIAERRQKPFTAKIIKAMRAKGT